MYYCIQLRFKILYNPGIILFFFFLPSRYSSMQCCRQCMLCAVLYAVPHALGFRVLMTVFPGYVAVPRWFMIFIFIDWL